MAVHRRIDVFKWMDKVFGHMTRYCQARFYAFTSAGQTGGSLLYRNGQI